MRKLTMLAAIGFGVWAGWRAACSGVVTLLLPPKSLAATRSDVGADVPSSTRPPVVQSQSEAVEKVLALLELGRERGIEVVQSVMRGRIGRVA